jgi:hypothetical protein
MKRTFSDSDQETIKNPVKRPKMYYFWKFITGFLKYSIKFSKFLVHVAKWTGIIVFGVIIFSVFAWFYFSPFMKYIFIEIQYEKTWLTVVNLITYIIFCILSLISLMLVFSEDLEYRPDIRLFVIFCALMSVVVWLVELGLLVSFSIDNYGWYVIPIIWAILVGVFLIFFLFGFIHVLFTHWIPCWIEKGEKKIQEIKDLEEIQIKT